MTELTQAETEPNPKDELTVDYAKDLLIQSFRFSQGSVNTQLYIFAYLHELHPEWQFNTDFGDQLYLAAYEPVGKIVHAAQRKGIDFDPDDYDFKLHVPEQERDSSGYRSSWTRITGKDIDRQLETMITAWSMVQRGKYQTDRFAADRLSQLLNTSVDELPKAGQVVGKLAGKMIGRDERYLERGRHLSYIKEYAFNGTTTSIPEYDRMFADIRGYVTDHPEILKPFPKVKALV